RIAAGVGRNARPIFQVSGIVVARRTRRRRAVTLGISNRGRKCGARRHSLLVVIIPDFVVLVLFDLFSFILVKVVVIVLEIFGAGQLVHFHDVVDQLTFSRAAVGALHVLAMRQVLVVVGARFFFRLT